MSKRSTQLETSFFKNGIDKFVIGTRALKRAFMWNYCSGRLPLYLVPEYPKSGGTWFSQMLADCLDIPFYRNTRVQKFESSVMSGHRGFKPAYQNVTCVFRDGRDVMVSAYFHFLFKNEVNRSFGVQRHRKHCKFENYDDTRKNMPAFIEYLFTTHSHGKRHFNWAEFVDQWLPHIEDYVTYERLLADPGEELNRTVKRLTGADVPTEKLDAVIEKYSFKNQAGRKQGEQKKNSFVRKGISGDWKNHFTPEACRVFNRFAGEQLNLLGYETDDEWIEMKDVDHEADGSEKTTNEFSNK